MKTDMHLQRDVMEELAWESGVNGAQIGVACQDGVVTLTGHVPVYSAKHAAELAAKRVHGVRAVANEIEVRPVDAHVRDDESLAAAAMHSLQWDADVPDAQVQVVVENGWITATGAVGEPHQRAAVDRVLRHLAGVRGVTNSVTLAPRDLPSECQQAIEAAFRRSATLDSKRLGVQVDGPTVVLTGDVHSLAELDEAARIAWSAPGVCNVQNCISITPWGYGPAEEWGY